MGNFNIAFNEDRDEMMPYFMAISSLESIGAVTYLAMQEFFDSPRDLFLASPEKIEKTGIFTKGQQRSVREMADSGKIKQVYDDTLRQGISYVCREDNLYPERLKCLRDFPTGLFFYGELVPEATPTVSVIGARECSFYGEEVAAVLGECLGRYKIPVISGMARGIDSLSQRASLEAGGKSYGVLGGGVDICYPRESYKLYENLKTFGGIISEYAPGKQPVRNHFVRRNRIISGLCDVLCVVEAKKKSGTLITVDCALEQGKDIYVVPGRITDRTSEGCNELVRQGAEIISNPENFVLDILNKYGVFSKDTIKRQVNDKNTTELSFLETKILKNVSENSFTPDDLLSVKELGRYANAYEILTACMNLSYEELLINMGGGRFRITPLGVKRRNNQP